MAGMNLEPERRMRAQQAATRAGSFHSNRFWLVPSWVAVARLVFAGWVLFPLLSACHGHRDEVVVYTSQDQVYAEPILLDFSRQTGIQVRPVFDSEAVKTVGLANRLLAERARPQCDVFWNNEELRTRQLAAQHTFRETNGWAAVGYRSRRLVINTNRLMLKSAPRSLMELTNQTWRRKVALAYPLFGTTAAHLAALRQHWGEAAWLDWCRALAANQPFLVEGNSVAAKQVARGEAWIGLTDSDDIAAEQAEGSPVLELPIGPETLLIPNTIAVIRGAPHPEQAQRLYEYLQRRSVTERLIMAKALEGFSVTEVQAPILRPDWPMLLRDLGEATEVTKTIFLR